jgi:CheY-like chemotaxis protein
VQLATIIDTAIKLAGPQVQEREQHLGVALPSVPILLHADPVRLSQTLANLLDNATKYTDPGGNIWLTATVDSSIVTIRVRDSGIGISPAMLPRIFNLFEQAHAGIEQSRGGLGIGLTIVRRLVELHGGTIDARSQGAGLGSEFTMRLPVAVDISASEARLTPEPLFQASSTECKQLRILVVEDMAATAASTAWVLRLWGHKVETSADGFSALECARAFQPDVILTDLGLPRMNGYQFAAEVRNIAGLEKVTLIAISGYGQPSDQQRSLDAGFARHLVKPVRLQELFHVLEAIPRKSDRVDSIAPH